MYSKTKWKARKGVNLNRFEKLQETNKSVILENAPTAITEPGTPFSVENMNKIEQGIYDAHEAVAVEAIARQQEDTSLAQAVTAEVNTRQQEDAALAQAVTTEAIARQQEDTSLAQTVTAEVNTRQQEDAALAQAVTTEANARQQEDTSLAQAVTAETQARTEGDQRLQAQIDVLLPEGLEHLQEYIADLSGLIEKKLPYTFIIDSNEKLAAWANNTPGNDYSRILIKAGTWSLTDTMPIAIDISDGRTKSVIGESGSKLVICPNINNVIVLKGNISGSYPNFYEQNKDYFLKNVTIELNSANGGTAIFLNCTNLTNCTGTSRDNKDTGCGFLNCKNLTNCNGTGYGYTVVQKSSYGYGFFSCTNLINCNGVGVGVGTSDYSDSSVWTSATGFYNCKNLTNCTGTGTKDKNFGTGYGFLSCRTGFGCKKGSDSTTNTFSTCYMEQSSGSTPWENTAAGGYNLP